MEPMLAGKYEPKKIEKILPMYGQIKLDGIRAFIKDGIAWTRSMKPVRSQQVQSFVAHNKLFLEGLDGEFVCGPPTAPDCYNRTNSSVMSANKPDEELHFYVFDMWDSAYTFEDRLAELRSLDFSGLSAGGQGRASFLETKLLTSIAEIDAWCEKKIQEGHEGIILRNPRSYYKFGRGTPVQGECIKIKDGRWFDTEARIIDAHELMSNQNEATLDAYGRTERSAHKENMIPMDTMGSIEVSGTFPSDPALDKKLWGKPYTTRIHGFTDALKAELWEDHKAGALIGKIAKFKFFTGGIKDKPRFPIYIGLRDADDMSPEQLSFL